MPEENYVPDYVRITLAEQTGAVKAFKKMADRGFQRFEGDMQEMMERGRYDGRYDEEDYKTVKYLKRDTGEY